MTWRVQRRHGYAVADLEGLAVRWGLGDFSTVFAADDREGGAELGELGRLAEMDEAWFGRKGKRGRVGVPFLHYHLHGPSDLEVGISFRDVERRGLGRTDAC